MRKYFAVFCVVLMAGAAAASAQQELRGRDWRSGSGVLQLRVVGDVDGNRVQDIADVVALLDFADGVKTPEAWQQQVGDLDLDGKLTLNDARLLLAKVDPDHNHYASRIRVEGDPSGGVLTTSSVDLLARLRGEARAADTEALSNANFIQVSGECTDCGGECVDGVSQRTIVTRLEFQADDAFAGIVTPNGGDVNIIGDSYGNCTDVGSTSFGADTSPSCIGDRFTRSKQVTLTTCATFTYFFDVSGTYESCLAFCGCTVPPDAQ